MCVCVVMVVVARAGNRYDERENGSRRRAAYWNGSRPVGVTSSRWCLPRGAGISTGSSRAMWPTLGRRNQLLRTKVQRWRAAAAATAGQCCHSNPISPPPPLPLGMLPQQPNLNRNQCHPLMPCASLLYLHISNPHLSCPYHPRLRPLLSS